MTRKDVIVKMFQAPVRNWMIDNVLQQKHEDWLDRDAGDFGRRLGLVKAYQVLDESFCWADTKEGHDFWRDIAHKLEAKNI